MSRPEEFLFEAEKYGKRDKLLFKVSELRQKSPYIKLEDAYELCWEEIKQEMV